jgi:hypothetical protein
MLVLPFSQEKDETLHSFVDSPVSQIPLSLDFRRFLSPKSLGAFIAGKRHTFFFIQLQDNPLRAFLQ